MRTSRSSLFVLALLALLPACQRPAPATGSDAGPAGASRAQATVTVKGSDTMVILGQRWAEEFMKKNPDVKLQVTGGGSGTGIAALINGTTDIAMSSRPIKPAEVQKVKARDPNGPKEIAVARDGITFYVHESNAVEALSVEQLRAIYLGDLKNWKEVGGPDKTIVLYSRENSSGTYVFVKDEVLKGEDFAPEAQTLPGTAAVVNAVSKETYGIGYGGGAYARGIKELKVRKTADSEAVAPNQENIQSGKYPLSRDLFFYLPGAAGRSVQSFIDFTLSPEGQKVVSEVGYYPVK